MSLESTQLQIVIADDHMVVRAGLRALIDRQPDMRVVGEAGDGHAAVEQAVACRADVAVMDLTMPGLSGLQATEQLHRLRPQLRIVILSVHEELSYISELRAAGANAYVLKRSAAHMLTQAIRAVAGGGFYLDPASGERLAAQERLRRPGAAREPQALSEREANVLRRLAHGYSHKEIAAQLNLSTRTIETYRARGMEKLGMESRVMLMRYALLNGWLQQL